MAKHVAIHEGVIRQNLLDELESFEAPDQTASSYYLNLDPRRWGGAEGVRKALKTTLVRERERIDQLDSRHEVRLALRRDLELTEKMAHELIGDSYTFGFAAFVSSANGQATGLRLPWSVRPRAFFEKHFVLWPLRQLLDQSDRYAVIVTDKDDARIFLYFLGRIETATSVLDEIPGRIRYPDRTRELEYVRKHIEAFHHHFENVSETVLRLFQKEPFEHVIIGGLWETLPQFESYLHRYIRDRIVARWDIDAQHTPGAEILERTRQEEQHVLNRHARQTWNAIQNDRVQRGALGPGEVFMALWHRRVQAMLVAPEVRRAGFRCTACACLHISDGPCSVCGANKAEVADVIEEAVHDAIEQDSQVRYWDDRALNEVESLAALQRFRAVP